MHKHTAFGGDTEGGILLVDPRLLLELLMGEIRTGIAAVLCLGLVGCAQRETRTETRQDVSLKIAERADFDALLEGLRGKVVLVDNWALWCHMCMEEFPHVVEWHRSYRDDGLAVVSIGFDDTSKQPEALAFLRQSGADFDNLMAAGGADMEAMEQFGLEGVLPAWKLYDRAGKLRHSFGEGKFIDLREVEVHIRELLREES